MNYTTPELKMLKVTLEAGFALSSGWDGQLPEYDEESLPYY